VADATRTPGKDVIQQAPKAVSKTVRRDFISTCCGHYWCPRANTSKSFAVLGNKKNKIRTTQKVIVVNINASKNNRSIDFHGKVILHLPIVINFADFF